MTLTDPRMTRFIMSLEAATRLVIDSVFFARGGDVLVTKMPVIRIADLAEVMREELAPRFGYAVEDIDIATVGPKPGEKLYEELMTSEEMRRAFQLKRFFVIVPALGADKDQVAHDYPEFVSSTVESCYTSDAEPALDKEELREFLRDNELLSDPAEPCRPAPARRQKRAGSG